MLGATRIMLLTSVLMNEMVFIRYLIFPNSLHHYFLKVLLMTYNTWITRIRLVNWNN